MKLQLVDFSGRLALMTYYPGYQDWWRHVSGVVVTALHCSVAIVTTSSPQSDVLMMEGGLILSPTFAPADGVMALLSARLWFRDHRLSTFCRLEDPSKEERTMGNSLI